MTSLTQDTEAYAPLEEPPKTLFEFALEHLQEWHQLHIVESKEGHYQLFQEDESGVLKRYRMRFEDEEGLTREELLCATDEFDIDNYLRVLQEQEEEAEDELLKSEAAGSR